MHVGSGYPYSTIRDAISDASSGDTVLVHNGTYIENIELLKRVFLKAADRSVILKPKNRFIPIIDVFAIGSPAMASGSTIQGFTITGANDTGSGEACGIRTNVDNITIKENQIIDNRYGIYIESDNCKVTNNCISYNAFGIVITWYCTNNKVYRNDFIGNTKQAVVEHSGNIFTVDKPRGGNYWSDYRGPDSNGDGFGDFVYSFIGGQDYLPLMEKTSPFK